MEYSGMLPRTLTFENQLGIVAIPSTLALCYFYIFQIIKAKASGFVVSLGSCGTA